MVPEFSFNKRKVKFTHLRMKLDLTLTNTTFKWKLERPLLFRGPFSSFSFVAILYQYKVGTDDRKKPERPLYFYVKVE